LCGPTCHLHFSLAAKRRTIPFAPALIASVVPTMPARADSWGAFSVPPKTAKNPTEGWVWAAAIASEHTIIHHEETAPAGSEAQWRATLNVMGAEVALG